MKHPDSPSAAPPRGVAPITRVALWVVTVVVALAAGVLSFDALREFGLDVGFPPHLAWLLPVAIEGGVAAATLAWRSGVATELGRRLTWAFLMLSVAGNAVHHATDTTGASPWWVAVVVIASAVPPALFGTVVHLAVEVSGAGVEPQVGAVVTASTAGGDEVATAEPSEDLAVPDPLEPSAALEPAATPLHIVATPNGEDVAGRDEDVEALAVEAIRDGAGRRKLVRELGPLGLTEHRAKALIATHRPGSATFTATPQEA